MSPDKPQFAGEWVRLEDLCIKGRSSLRQKDIKNDGRFPVYGASGVVGTMASYQIDVPYVAVVKDGAGVGRATICKANSSVLGTMQALIPKSEIQAEYLYHLVQSLNLGAGFSGSTIPHIYFKDYGKRRVRMHPAEARQSIVTCLAGIERRVKSNNDLLEQLILLNKSRFVEIFGDAQAGYKYSVSKLGSLLSVKPQNGLYKPQSYYVDTGGVPIVRVDAFQSGLIEDPKSLKRLICTNEEVATYGLRNNDIVINRVNGSIERVGKIAWIRGLAEPTVFESNMMRFHIDESILDISYATTFLNSCDIRKQIKSSARIANQCSINQGNVADFDIPVPPLSLQQEFAAFVSQVDKLRFGGTTYRIVPLDKGRRKNPPSFCILEDCLLRRTYAVAPPQLLPAPAQHA